ncbi:MAG: DNA gyrase inhibitor YacG [Gammaproteobacteria bacterium]|nr:DNA gyrase inhibitor YacG [Gammaproteobacteria bacterium]
MAKIVTCPQCGKLVEWVPEQQWRPFCSERCKLIDLGDWAAENHRIPDKSPPIDIDDYNPSDYH